MASDLYLWEMAAIALLEYACGYDKGRSKDDPVYIAVTEGRDGPTPQIRKGYSSCGDLAHWYLTRLGVRDTWINRKPRYRVGLNVALLSGCPIYLRAPSDPAWRPRPGDVLLIWNSATGTDAHVCACLGVDESTDHTKPPTIHTANYGAGGMSPAASPGARLSVGPLTKRVDGWYIGHRKVQRQITLESIVARRTATPDLSGALVTGALLDALGANYAQ